MFYCCGWELAQEMRRRLAAAHGVWSFWALSPGAHPPHLTRTHCVAGLLRHPEGPGRVLALPDLRPGRRPAVRAVSQEGWRYEGHAGQHQVGPRQLCPLDPRGTGSAVGLMRRPAAVPPHRHGDAL